MPSYSLDSRKYGKRSGTHAQQVKNYRHGTGYQNTLSPATRIDNWHVWIRVIRSLFANWLVHVEHPARRKPAARARFHFAKQTNDVSLYHVRT
jgi:hypothetical protein